VNAIARPTVEDEARRWLTAEIAAGRLSATPSLEVLGRVAVMLTGSPAQPRIKRAHRRLAPAQAQVPAATVGDLKVIELTPKRSRQRAASQK
jgi:hypothetical protein